jgi:hypothetical protein
MEGSEQAAAARAEMLAPKKPKRESSYFALCSISPDNQENSDLEVFEAKTKTELVKKIKDCEHEIEVLYIFKGKEIQFKVKSALDFT